MALAVDIKRVELEEICRRHSVHRLELFGSAARHDFEPHRSDLDFLVEFQPIDAKLAFDTYFGLKEDLETLFGRTIDLVMSEAVRNPYVQVEIDRDRTLLYAA